MKKIGGWLLIATAFLLAMLAFFQEEVMVGVYLFFIAFLLLIFAITILRE